MYKNIYFIIAVICLGLCLSSCEEDLTNVTQEAYNLRLSRDTVFFNVGGGMKSVEVKTNQSSWKLIRHHEETWLSVEEFHDAGAYQMITITADSSSELSMRESSLTVEAGGQFSEQLVIMQLGNTPTIYLERDSIVVDKDTAVIILDLMSNIDFTIEHTADWLQVERKNDDTEGSALYLYIAKNETGSMREDLVELKQVDGDFSRFIYVSQASELGTYEPISTEDIKGNKQIPVVSGLASSTLEGSDISKAFDGDYDTYFQSAYKEQDPIEFTFKLDAGTDLLNYIIYYPAIEELQPDTQLIIKVARIYVKKKGEVDFSSVGIKPFKKYEPKVIELTTALADVEEVKFQVIETYAPRGSTFSATCGEVEFYTHSVLYPNVFADITYSELLPNVTIGDILNIKDEFYQNIAKHLYNGTYEFDRILDLPPIQQDRVKAKVNAASLFEHATGIYLSPGEESVVFCDEFSGAKPAIVVLSSNGNIESHELMVGINKITTQAGGKLYVNNPKAIKIHITNGKVLGKLSINNLAELDQLEEPDDYVIDILGSNTHFVAPVVFAKMNQELLLQFESKISAVVNDAQKFYGVDAGDYQVKSKLGFYLGTEAKDIETLVCLDKGEIEIITNTEGNYSDDAACSVMEKIGNAYEPYLNKLWGIKDVSAKLFALSYLYENNAYSLIKDKKYYAQAIEDIIVADVFYSNISNEWIKVVPLWQLYHYIKNISGINDYYAQMSNRVKMRTSFSNYTNDLLNYTNQITGEQYQDFFYGWRMGVGEELAEPSKLGLVYYVEDNMSLYSANNDPVPGIFYSNFGILSQSQNVVAVEVYNRGLVHVTTYTNGSFNVKTDWSSYQSGMTVKVVGASGVKLEPAYY